MQTTQTFTFTLALNNTSSNNQLVLSPFDKSHCTTDLAVINTQYEQYKQQLLDDFNSTWLMNKKLLGIEHDTTKQIDEAIDDIKSQYSVSNDTLEQEMNEDIAQAKSDIHLMFDDHAKYLKQQLDNNEISIEEYKCDIATDEELMQIDISSRINNIKAHYDSMKNKMFSNPITEALVNDKVNALQMHKNYIVEHNKDTKKFAIALRDIPFSLTSLQKSLRSDVKKTIIDAKTSLRYKFYDMISNKVSTSFDSEYSEIDGSKVITSVLASKYSSALDNVFCNMYDKLNEMMNTVIAAVEFNYNTVEDINIAKYDIMKSIDSFIKCTELTKEEQLEHEYQVACERQRIANAKARGDIDNKSNSDLYNVQDDSSKTQSVTEALIEYLDEFIDAYQLNDIDNDAVCKKLCIDLVKDIKADCDKNLSELVNDVFYRKRDELLASVSKYITIHEASANATQTADNETTTAVVRYWYSCFNDNDLISMQDIIDAYNQFNNTTVSSRKIAKLTDFEQHFTLNGRKIINGKKISMYKYHDVSNEGSI